jgi:hypothetical protein
MISKQEFDKTNQELEELKNINNRLIEIIDEHEMR